MSGFLKNLHWRYATKNFDPNAPLSQGDKKKILDAIRMAPTSFGLQPFKVHLVEDQETKDKICAAGWKQPQYSTAALVLAFSSLGDMDARITQYMDLACAENPQLREKLKGYEDMMRGFLVGKDPDWIHAWGARQAYIALGFAMAACAELKIDSCPMEGFSPKEVDQILGLSENERSCVLLTIGSRHPDDAPKPKVRFPEKDLFQ